MRIERQGAVQDVGGFAQASGNAQRLSQLLMRGMQLRVALRRNGVVLDGLVEPPLPGQDIAQIEVRPGASWLEVDGTAQTTLGLVVFAGKAKGTAEVGEHRRVIGRQAQPLAVAGHRLVVTAQHCQCVAQIRQRRRVAGMDRQGPAAGTGGILVPSHTALDHAQQRPDLSVAGVLRAGLS